MPSSTQNAITTAMVTTLKTALASYIPTVAGNVPATIADAYVGLTEGGEPHPLVGEWFAGVHKDPVSQNQAAPGGRYTYVDEVFSLQVTVSMRVTRYASDKVPHDAYPLLQDKVRAISNYIANNPYTVMNAINSLMTLTSTNGFIEPFYCANPSPPIQKRGRTWFKGASKASSQGTLAVSSTLRFEGLRRIQATGAIS